MKHDYNILVFGTGKICKRYRETLEKMNIVAFLDNDIEKNGQLLWGKKICTPKEGIKKYDYDIIYIMTTSIYEVVAQLEKMGVSPSQIKSYLSIDDKLGEPILKDKFPKISSTYIKDAVKGNIAIFPDEDSVIEIFKYISQKIIILKDEKIPTNIDLIVYHGFSMTEQKANIYRKAVERKIPIAFSEDGFLRSVIPCGFHGKNEWSMGRSVILDGRGLYINAFSESEIERMLNSDFKLNSIELDRTVRIIKKITKNYLSKYNNQPIIKFVAGRKNIAKVLIIDQVPGDKSIKYGMAKEMTFYEMLEVAIKDNPNSDILIKTHPATQKSHYGDIKEKGYENVYVIDYPLNPIALLKLVDKVYVCTSQMGFEALMCGKEVHVFGMPFYAGWGITNDRITCVRRRVKRTLEEIFYVAYVLLPIYISTKKGKCCEIEEVIDELINLRDEYFSSMIEK